MKSMMNLLILVGTTFTLNTIPAFAVSEHCDRSVSPPNGWPAASERIEVDMENRTFKFSYILHHYYFDHTRAQDIGSAGWTIPSPGFDFAYDLTIDGEFFGKLDIALNSSARSELTLLNIHGEPTEVLTGFYCWP